MTEITPPERYEEGTATNPDGCPCRMLLWATAFYESGPPDVLDECPGCGHAVDVDARGAYSVPFDALLCPACARTCDTLCNHCWAPLSRVNGGECRGNHHMLPALVAAKKGAPGS